MIDIETEVFSTISTSLKTAFPGITVEGDQSNKPAKFPTVHIEEVDNYVVRSTMDSGGVENHAYIMYEVSVYSNKQAGRKAEAKRIFKKVDSLFGGLGFVRMGTVPIYMDSVTIYRMAGRYSAIVSADGTIYNRR